MTREMRRLFKHMTQFLAEFIDLIMHIAKATCGRPSADTGRYMAFCLSVLGIVVVIRYHAVKKQLVAAVATASTSSSDSRYATVTLVHGASRDVPYFACGGPVIVKVIEIVCGY
jgi:hypothetical protein